MIKTITNNSQSLKDKLLNESDIINHNKKKRFPQWLKKTIPVSNQKSGVENCLRHELLHTVCEEAKCPNRTECFAKGTATFLLMGGTCTRNCLFCGVKSGIPLPLDLNEPQHICNAVKKMNLSYVVLTSVNRDDLTDGGARHIAKTIIMLKQKDPNIKVEILVPDFNGNMNALETVLASEPDVFNHNIETVESLFTQIRPNANYHLSLKILRNTVKYNSALPIKSGFMVGLGETEDEVILLMKDLRKSQVTNLTIGQYLQPSKNQINVKEFITPDQFDYYKTQAKKLGFSKVNSGPFIRSSYNAAEIFNN